MVILCDDLGYSDVGFNGATDIRTPSLDALASEGKGSTYEGGYRVPMFFHWTGRVPAGRRYDYPITALDFYPTFAGLAGASIPAGKQLDGRDIWRDLVSGRDPRPSDLIFALRHRGGYSDVGARQDQWKIARVGQGPWRLFDIERDIGETRDLSAQHPDQLEKMVSQTETWSRDHTEPEWFHEPKARDVWQQTGMPNFDKTFSLVHEEASGKAEPVNSGGAKGASTKAEFIAAQRVKHEEKGWPFDPARVGEQFDVIDANGDGIASGKEKRAYWDKVMQERSSN